MTVNDPDAIVRAVLMHMGAALVAMPHAMRYLESGEMVRVLPDCTTKSARSRSISAARNCCRQKRAPSSISC
ncbi:MAG TPA: hypothetical protein VF774_21035 [Pseudoduganella sp.]|jgi:DNA-binding transcriptional LysR family regulator